LQNIDKILIPYFSKDEINEIRKILSAKGDKRLVSSREVTKESKKVDPWASPSRAQVDLLITYASKKLNRNKFIQFLLTLGETLKNRGQYDSAISIFNSIVDSAGIETKLANIKINCYLAIADIYEKQAYWNECLMLVKKAKNAFQQLNDNKGIAFCENFLGTVWGERGEIKKAKSHFELSLSLLNPSKDKALVGILEINLGILSNMQGNFDEAFTYFQRALVKFEQTRDVNRMAELTHNIGMLFTQKGEYKKALTEFDKSIALSLGYSFLSKLGITYLSKAFIYTQQKDYPLASAFADKAMEICEKLNDRLSMADIYKIKGIIERNQANYKQSENYLLTSLRINQELSNSLNKAETMLELGRLYAGMKQKERALDVFKSSLDYFRTINSSGMVKKLKEEISQIK
jgi:tetratricopeptide (TPR) repeat protein